MPFLLGFFLISILEIYTFAFIGSEIGPAKTLILCFMTAIIGGFLVKWQGLNAFMSVQKAFLQGKIPVEAFFDGLCIVIAGFILITPGFVTDMVGFLLLIPPFRAILKKYAIKYAHFTDQSTYSENQNDNVIEGEYENVSKTKTPLDK